MEINIRYFGQLEELTAKKEEVINQEFKTLEELKNHLVRTYPELEKIHFKMAQDNRIEVESSEIKGSVIDLLPPFSGG